MEQGGESRPGKEKAMTGFDKEVERRIRFWEQERNCVILISQLGASTVMDVLYKEDGRVEKDIYLGSRQMAKERMLIEMRNYFKRAAQ